ncbi:MAG: glutamine synthetase III [Oscillospiraceae bacterium]|nr:glutamine synthetase III [Oscillospiraceae bacterium]
MAFNDDAMRNSLSQEVYQSLQQTIRQGKSLDPSIADEVASAMKDWAIEHGATHYTHWFQPMSGVTAEKHDSFLSIDPKGRPILEFSGSELIKGEPDASSFPSGGLRATFEARGYTTWDPTSYAFIKDNTLCIPTAFCTYSGHALDKKTPLLRSMDALSKQAVRILRLFGDEVTARVTPSVGVEQEYFLIDRELFRKRKDLVYAGRTLFGSRAPKEQELDDHYFGAFPERVSAFMKELDEALWDLGVYAKTEHNEVAPAQYEMAMIHSTANIAVDHNQLTMEVMQKIAERNNLVCLLHEKPFAGVNGSGKHNNWSLSTDWGQNLLSPGDTPHENEIFLLFLTAVIRAVDEYQDLIRMSVASAGNDHRLGANEAPPAIISIFLGEELTGILDSIEKRLPYEGTEKTEMKLGVLTLPRFPKDTADRNRTSPVAFTGNRFEFRMPGSSDTLGCMNAMINASVADVLRDFADHLENEKDLHSALYELIRTTYRDHRRIVFNGNGYDASWILEAEKRGLTNDRTTPDCLPALVQEKNRKMLERMGVYSETELQSRYGILLDIYCKTILIEARTMVDMVRRQILPSVGTYLGRVAQDTNAKKMLIPELECKYEMKLVRMLTDRMDQIESTVKELETALASAASFDSGIELSHFLKEDVIELMERLRTETDAAEIQVSSEYWPFPVYGDLFFGF